ncbi:MAG: hypothetical protein GDA38_27355 [Hormoscilla sp. SP12CHS1]|nr:hypothetical protein [Hormoscilla sp. SP12CHS1]
MCLPTYLVPIAPTPFCSHISISSLYRCGGDRSARRSFSSWLPKSHQASKAEIAVLVELPQMPHQPIAGGYFVHEQHAAEVG